MPNPRLEGLSRQAKRDDFEREDGNFELACRKKSSRADCWARLKTTRDGSSRTLEGARGWTLLPLGMPAQEHRCKPRSQPCREDRQIGPLAGHRSCRALIAH